MQGEPLTVMRMEHNQIGDLIGRAQSTTDLARGRALTTQMIDVIRGHFREEEQVLFRLAQQCLNEEDLSILGATCAQRRALSLIL